MIIRPATENDAQKISQLIISVSKSYVLDAYSDEGQKNYLRTIDPVSIGTYIRSGFRYFVAEEEGELCGVIAIRDQRHVYHLFVSGAHQQKGIARQLWKYACAQMLKPGKAGIFTVNSSPNAVAVYKRLGFYPTSPPVEKSGVVSTPMQIIVNMPAPLPELIIESNRLRLKPINKKYREEIFREFTPAITAFMYPPSPDEISETDAFIESVEASLGANEDYQVAVIEKGSEEFVGCSGIHKIFRRHPELGIWIKESAHGKGYGKEAIFTLKAWADQYLDYEYMKYPVDRRNKASTRIPEELGGQIGRTYEIENLSGNMLDICEYHIYPE